MLKIIFTNEIHNQKFTVLIRCTFKNKKDYLSNIYL